MTYDNLSAIKSKLVPIQQWLSDDALAGIYSSAYWNDIEEERKKEWWIADGDYDRCMTYLRRAGLLTEWAVVEEYLSGLPEKTRLAVADLAAGIGWTSALLSKLDRVAEVHATEISRHRLNDLFPYAIDMLEGNPEKIRRYIGSFYNLGFKDESMDIVFLSQAFHHADQPLKLLGEIDRVTRKGGTVILTGENYISEYSQMKRAIKNSVKFGRFAMNFFENFPPDNIGGDHYYRLTDYYLFFQLLGYKLHHQIVNKRSLVLIADKPH